MTAHVSAANYLYRQHLATFVKWPVAVHFIQCIHKYKCTPAPTPGPDFIVLEKS